MESSDGRYAGTTEHLNSPDWALCFPQYENQADIPQQIKGFVEGANQYLLDSGSLSGKYNC